MILREPPTLATWLLDRLGYSRRNSALAGDLLEEFRSGRSAAWYWRQTLMVIAAGVSRNAIVLRTYLTAVSAAYVAQFAVTLLLWSRHSPSLVHASGWGKVGVWALAQVASPVYRSVVNRVVVGVSRVDLPRMCCTVEGAPPRSTVVGLAAHESFTLGLGNYCLCALVFWRFSLSELVSVELSWFVLWVLLPALFFVRTSEATVEPEEPSFTNAPEEIGLSVALPDGRTVLLRAESVAESAFESADAELIALLFGRGRNLELIRRAIWLESARLSRSYGFLPPPPDVAIPLSALADLLDEVERTDSVEIPVYTKPKLSLWKRVHRGFFGQTT